MKRSSVKISRGWTIATYAIRLSVATSTACAISTASSATCGTEWRWTGKAADLIRRRIRGILVGDPATSSQRREQKVGECRRIAPDPLPRAGAGALVHLDLLGAAQVAQAS